MLDEASLDLYEKPACTTCRQLRKLLEEEGVVERGDRAVLRRPVERVRELFS